MVSQDTGSCMKNNQIIIILERLVFGRGVSFAKCPIKGMLVRSDMQTRRMISYAISYCSGVWRCRALLARKDTKTRMTFPALSGFGWTCQHMLILQELRHAARGVPPEQVTQHMVTKDTAITVYLSFALTYVCTASFSDLLHVSEGRHQSQCQCFTPKASTEWSQSWASEGPISLLCGRRILGVAVSHAHCLS